jgi:hypothetical protein
VEYKELRNNISNHIRRFLFEADDDPLHPLVDTTGRKPKEIEYNYTYSCPIQ